MNITVNGYKINYKESGSGDRVAVMLQGWGTALSVYDSVASCINDGYRFIQLDLPGFGDSDEPKEGWNVDAFTDFFISFMEKLSIKKATLIGHSYGGRIIIKLASRKDLPFEIEKIVLIDSAGILPQKTLLQKFKIRQYKILKKVFAVKLIYALFPELVDDWRNRQGSADYKNASPVMRQCLVMSVNEDLTALLPNIKQDTLLVWGDKDTATPISDAHKMDELIENAGLCVLEGCGHYSFLEKPAQFKGILRAFMMPEE
ncbi:MAG: alpha/beta hydrolase [Lachnospiraceae bacterium]|nr:alpha/beta hydrolase [Lachnospiraceae bacterium]